MLTPRRRSIHDLKLGDRLALILHIGSRSGRLSPNDGQFHMFDLDPY
jgi:hypothetical protein